VAATAFLPILILPLTGVTTVAEATTPYANEVIYLYLGGFLMALAIERCGLHRRFAFFVLSLVGPQARGLVLAFMVTAALISMWISNSSTALMLLPIAVSLARVTAETVPDVSAKEKANFGTVLMLGLAYAATIGGVATLVGTPPNALMASFAKETYGIEIDFSAWMAVGVPVMMVLLPITWALMVFWLYPVSFRASPEARAVISDMRMKLGPMSVAEWRTALLFLVLVAAWVLRPQMVEATGIKGLTDSVIAMTVGLATFLIPSGQGRRPLMRWEDTATLPWGVLVLFGGGLSLAAAVSSSGLANWLGDQLSPLGVFGVPALVIGATVLVIFLTELTSNLATTATFLPVVGAIAVEVGAPPLMFLIPVTLAASCAFMLPVATPPNAIVYGSGLVSILQMAKTGFWLNLISVAILSVVALVWAPQVFK
jgi:sodium-dependent dicarboxylate transporter 2/3/5